MNDKAAPGLEFPCQLPIKAMGPSASGLDEIVLTIVTRHVGEVQAEQVRVRPSSAGRYESVTVTVQIESREQMEKIYAELANSDSVLWTL